MAMNYTSLLNKIYINHLPRHAGEVQEQAGSPTGNTGTTGTFLSDSRRTSKSNALASPHRFVSAYNPCWKSRMVMFVLGMLLNGSTVE